MGTLIINPYLNKTFNVLNYDPIVWLDASDFSTLTLVNGKVSSWASKGTTQFSVTQSSDSLRPTYSATGLNGSPTLDWGTNTNSIKLFDSTVLPIPRCIFVLGEYDGTDPSNAFHGLLTQSNRILFTTESTQFYPGDSWSSNSYAWINASTGIANIFYNGSSIDSGVVALPTISSPFVMAAYNNTWGNTIDGLVVGMDRSNGNRGWKGKISEILIFDYALTDEQKINVNQYLLAKI